MKTKFITFLNRLIILVGAIMLFVGIALIINQHSCFREFCHKSYVTEFKNSKPLPKGTTENGLDISGLVELSNTNDGITPLKLDFKENLRLTVSGLFEDILLAESGLFILVSGIGLAVRKRPLGFYNFFREIFIFSVPFALLSVLIIYPLAYLYSIQLPFNEFIKIYKVSEWQNMYTATIETWYGSFYLNILLLSCWSLILSGVCWMILPLLKETTE